jgi:hypothetical protein
MPMPVFAILSRLPEMKGRFDMNRNTIAYTIITLNLAASIALGEESGTTVTLPAGSGGSSVQIRDSQPFTHLAQIPADADKGTIRFERAKVVQVPTRITYTMDPSYCEELAFRDPGGAMYCPSVQKGSPAVAYEVTYSYVGQPLASDEYGGRNFTFQVYFRADELALEVRQSLAEKKWNQADFAEYFQVNTFREPVRRILIDEAKSHFCNGSFADGAWTQSEANCQDEIHTKAIASWSDYITVRVDPVSAMAGRVSTEKGLPPSVGGK